VTRRGVWLIANCYLLSRKVFPDEEGIETVKASTHQTNRSIAVEKCSPMRRGLRLTAEDLIQCDCYGWKVFPDEKGIETINSP